jgi:hypothetical protein
MTDFTTEVLAALGAAWVLDPGSSGDQFDHDQRFAAVQHSQNGTILGVHSPSCECTSLGPPHVEGQWTAYWTPVGQSSISSLEFVAAPSLLELASLINGGIIETSVVMGS